MILKNSFGVTSVMSDYKFQKKVLNPFGGSSLNRKKNVIKGKRLLNDVIIATVVKKKIQDKSMSTRTKSKIRKKVIAFSQLYKRLSFLTLTFVNKIEDEKAILILRKFLDNTKKRSKDFQYLWVAERQTKNAVFVENIHFHLITNKYWDINKHWKYWLELQKKNGIVPRDENFKPSSALDVRGLVSNNIKGIASYLTKYITKNKSILKCQVWNCSKKISALYTDFYSDYSFLEALNRVEGIEIKEIPLDYCNLHLIPLNRKTMPFYDRLKEKNKRGWDKKARKEVAALTGCPIQGTAYVS